MAGVLSLSWRYLTRCAGLVLEVFNQWQVCWHCLGGMSFWVFEQQQKNTGLSLAPTHPSVACRVAPCPCSDRHAGISQAGLFGTTEETRHVLPASRGNERQRCHCLQLLCEGGWDIQAPHQVHVGSGRGLRKTQTGNKPQSGSSLPRMPTHFQSLLPTGLQPQDVTSNSLCPCLPCFLRGLLPVWVEGGWRGLWG